MFFYVLTSCLIRPSYFNISLRSLQFNFSPTPAAVGNLYCPSWPPPPLFQVLFPQAKKSLVSRPFSFGIVFCFKISWIINCPTLCPFVFDSLPTPLFCLLVFFFFSTFCLIWYLIYLPFAPLHYSINMKIPFWEEEQSESQYLTWDSEVSLVFLKFSDAKRLSIVSMSILNFSLSLLDITILKSVKLSGY